MIPTLLNSIYFVRPRASIALISLLVISAMSLILVIGMSEVSISNYQQYANTDASQILYYVGESCFEEALIRIEDDANGFEGTTLTFDDDTSCTISVTGGGPKTIAITASYLDYTQSYQGEVTVAQQGQATNVDLISWQEI